MGRVRVVDEPPAWQIARDVAAPEELARLTDQELSHEFRVHHPGDDGTLRLFEMKLPPNSVVEPHSHDPDEIIYVVAGQLILGARRLDAGSSIFIPGGTLYSLRSGPEGLQFLNFRPRPDSSHHSKAEHRTAGRVEK